MATSDCLDENAVVAFLAGRTPASQRPLVASHLEACGACTELVTWVAADLAHRSRAPGAEGRPFIGPLASGTRVDRYHILSAVGRGGMGEVYAAYHPDLDRRVALKVVHESGADTAERRARLLREARAIARLSHPNVVTVHDAGTFDDRVFIAMEFVEGQTVEVWLRAEPRSWREILDVFVAAGRGLAAAHAAGIVHRDFKPQNVMIGRDGTVRVMDFGLARLAEEPPEASDGQGETAPPADLRARATTVTKTGALLGTLAYMAPEQFRGEPLDARADQFSFCVALHEALYGRRPSLRHLDDARAGTDAEVSATFRAAGSPAWLRGVLARGLSESRDQRFSSMDALLAALTRARTRLRRQTARLLGGLAVALLSLGAWRLGAAHRVSCAVPTDQLAAVWSPTDGSHPRRQAVHRAFAATGLPTAEAAWRRVAGALDEYTKQWAAMHVSACEATHVRGDQSSEVLDLRMGCLAETLDGVRALTDVLARVDARMVPGASTAVENLAPVSQCANVPALRSAVPVPRDEKIANAVEDVRRSLRDAFALYEVGNERDALAKAQEALPRAEATRYGPLVAEVLYLIGSTQTYGAPKDAEKFLERAFDVAEAARDDSMAAKAAISLVLYTGMDPDQRHECDRWASLAHAILDRLPPPQRRLRAWLLTNEGGIRNRRGEFEAARPLLEEAMVLKEEELGRNHSDVTRTAISLVATLTELGRPEEARRLADRRVEILGARDPDNALLALMLSNRGDALNALRRYEEAARDYETSLRILRGQFGPTSPMTAYPLAGLGAVKLGEGDPDGAAEFLEQALSLRGSVLDDLTVADTRFALARALAAGGRDRNRARLLAASAHQTYASQGRTGKQRAVDDWLAAHGGAAKP